MIDYDDFLALQIIWLLGAALVAALTFRALHWLNSRRR